jgi:sigma-B regulation protein RsbU (phosphoserine phosphatase)
MKMLNNKNLIRAGFIVLAAFILSLSVYNLFRVATQMTDENLYANRKDGVVFIQINPRGVSEQAGLQVGDRLIKINGDSIHSAVQAQAYLDRAKPGESLIYTIERAGLIFNLKVSLALGGLRIFQVGFLTAGLMLFILALTFVLLKPEIGQVRLWTLAMFMLSFILLNITQVRTVQGETHLYQGFNLLYIGNLFFMIATLGHAVLYYPEQKYVEIKRFWMIQVNYILSGFMFLLALYLYSAYHISPLLLLWIPLLYLVMIEIIFRKKRRKSYLARTRMIKIVLLTMAVIVFIATPFMYYYHLLEYISFLFCAIPIVYAFTTIRYRVYDIHLRLRLSTFYFMIQIFLAVLFVLILAAVIGILPTLKIDLPAFFITGTTLEMRKLSQLPSNVQTVVQKGYLLLIGIGLTFLLYLFLRYLQRLVDRLFFQQKYDYRQALKNFVEILSSYLTRETISTKSVEQIHSIMKIKGTLLAVKDNGRFRIAAGKGALAEQEIKSFTIVPNLNKKWLVAGKPIQLEELTSIPELAPIRQEIFCAIPVIAGGQNLEALLFTAEKLSESAYNNDDLELLSLFGEHLGTAFERAGLYEQMADKERIKRELEIARDIQINSLPKNIPRYPGLQISASLSPATEVGGDYYDYFEFSAKKLGIIVGDVVGKGTSAALYMSKIQGFLRTLVLEKLEPDVMLQRLNTLIRDNFDPEFFFTALYGIFLTASHSLQLFRLGHNGLFYYDAQKRQARTLEPAGMGFGMAENEIFSENVRAQQIKYRPGDIFLFLTDGFTEAMNENRQVFGEKRILEFLDSHAEHNAEIILEQLNQEIFSYSSGHQFDDATAVVVKIIA